MHFLQANKFRKVTTRSPFHKVFNIKRFFYILSLPLSDVEILLSSFFNVEFSGTFCFILWFLLTLASWFSWSSWHSILFKYWSVFSYSDAADDFLFVEPSKSTFWEFLQLFMESSHLTHNWHFIPSLVKSSLECNSLTLMFLGVSFVACFQPYNIFSI